jgi:hypothetical protein
MNSFKKGLNAMTTPRKVVISRGGLFAGLFFLTACLATPLWAAPFFFATGSPNGLLGALSRRPSAGKVETETADDFALQVPTVITRATIFGLLPAGTPLDTIKDVEIEVYHVFPLDSAPFSQKVPTRTNSPSDVEIETATRARSAGTLSASASVLNPAFIVNSTVVNGISVKTGGEGPLAGEEVEIDLTFTSPIILPAGSYFFRPEVSLTLTNGDFLYLSGARPIVAPAGTPFTPDRQAWIRNSTLAPDWLRIGTDIINGATPPTFNMAFSLTGETVPDVGTPGQPNCHGQSISALAHQFGGIDAAASSLGFSSVGQLQAGFALFCE